MRARYYNPEIKRFINQDVIEGNITNSPSLNRYAYCQGNPVSLLDPFGLSPQINLDWSGLGEAGHGVLSLLGMMPTVGAAFDMLNAAWYYAEGNYGEAALSFFGALPGIGDMAVAGVKGLGFCTKGAKIFRLAAKIIGNAGNIVLSVPKVTDAIIQLWDKHVFKGQAWDDKSLSLAIEGVTFGITAILSAKNLGETFGNIRGELTDIVTSQCFVEGTLVLTENGQKPIEEIRPGDRVFASDPETGESGYKEVVQTFENETEELVHIYVNGDEIVSTPNHPFYVPQKGWTRAVDLRAGDILVLSNDEYVVVEQVQHEILEAPIKVYNFEVQDFHTYYVGKNSVLVHNKCNEPKPGDSDYKGKLPSNSWKLVPNGNGAHLVEISNIKGRVKLSIFNTKNTPRYYPNGSPANAGQAHIRLHRATSSFGIHLRGGNPSLTDNELLNLYSKAYNSPTLNGILGDLRTPDGSIVLDRNISPGEAFKLLIEWGKNQNK